MAQIPSSRARIPPRFVPTLTERVDPPGAPAPAEHAGVPDLFSAPSAAPETLLPAWQQLDPRSSPVSSSAHVSTQQLSAEPPVDRNFRQRVAALRDKNSTALTNAPWFLPVDPPASPGGLPEHVPVPGLAENHVERAAPAVPGTQDRLGQLGVANIVPRISAQQAHEFEQLLVHRVLQRVDVALDLQLHATIDAVVQVHCANLQPELHDAVEGLVRDAVRAAVSTELTG